MEDSLFAAMRIVAMMLGVDRKIHTEERKWFLAVLNTFGANYSQRQILRQDLECKSIRKLDSIFLEVSDPQDRTRLMNLLRVAMNADGEITAKEKEFFAKITKLNENPAHPMMADYQALGKTIQQHESEIRLWQLLGEVGKLYSATRFPTAMSTPANAWAPIELAEHLVTRKVRGTNFYRWILTLILIAVIAAPIYYLIFL